MFKQRDDSSDASEKTVQEREASSIKFWKIEYNMHLVIPNTKQILLHGFRIWIIPRIVIKGLFVKLLFLVKKLKKKC